MKSMVGFGYKQTEVGVIPEAWDIKPLGQFVALQRGHDLTERDRKEGEIPVMGSAGPNGFHDTALVRGPGVVLGRSGASFGQAHYCTSDFWPHNTCLYVTDFHGNDELFTFYFLKAIDFSRHNSGGAQQSLNRNFIAPILVAVPPRKEQESIAEALSDADALIESLEHLIAKKRHLKQGAMQDLLTGKKRLPGFSGDWLVSRLVDLCPLQRGFDLPTTRLQPGIHPVVYSNGVLRFHACSMVNGPGVVTGRSGTIGNVHYLEEDFWPHNTSLWVTNFKGNSPKFIYYLLTSSSLERFSTGSGIPTLNRNDVHSHIVQVPRSEDEQSEIATILSDMDVEIAALEAKLSKARQLKQGMMQELLTGKTRLS